MNYRRFLPPVLILVTSLVSVVTGQPQLDKLLREATTLPASQPASRPATQPVEEEPVRSQAIVSEGMHPGRPDAISGKVEMSNGQTLSGQIYTTRDAPFRVFLRDQQKYEDVPPAAVARLDAVVEWERMEDDWRFLEGGSDVKIKTGQQYPARKTLYQLTLLDGTTLTGDLKAPLWVRDDKEQVRQVVLYQRTKGELGQKLADLVYVKAVIFAAPASQPAGK